MANTANNFKIHTFSHLNKFKLYNLNIELNKNNVFNWKIFLYFINIFKEF